MGTESTRLDYWRKFFRGANSDIFDVIENAILVAASDRRVEFRGRRDRIAELLFSCRAVRCVGCDRVQVQAPDQEEEEGGEFGRGRDGGDEGGVEKGSNASDAEEGVNQMLSNYSYDEAEALTEEIEEESQIVREVLRIKDVLANGKDESDSVLFESLRRLQLMRLSVETLQVTEIGKAVKVLCKHSSKQIRQLVRTLIHEWKVMVDEWYKSAPILEETTPESTNPSNFDLDDGIDGLPFPPLDEGAFLATQTTSIELSKFFDGMDDDGNPQNFGEFDKIEENRKNPILENHNHLMRKLPSYSSSLPDNRDLIMIKDSISNTTSRQEAQNRLSGSQEPQNEQARPQEAPNRPRKLQDSSYKLQESVYRQSKSNTNLLDSVPVTHQKPRNEYRFNNDLKSHPPYVPAEVRVIKSHPPYVPAEAQRKPQTAIQNKSKPSEDNSVRAKLEIAKRKLHEGYQQAENAKKQRTIQVMELNDLPKQGLNRKPPNLKQGNLHRHRANGRC